MKTLTKRVIAEKDVSFKIIEPFITAQKINVDSFYTNNKPIAPPCFLGAYYRKCFSSKEDWLGIEGVVRLGEFIPDERRFQSDGRVDYERYLDNPSIYLGGKSLTESDAGLNFNVGHESIQDIKMLNYGSKKVAYRPFYRYIYSEVIDDNGNVTRINKNIWKVASPLDFDYYYFPGDVVKMSVYSPLENYLQLRIEVLEETKIEKYQKKRKKYQLKGKPKVYYSPLFYSEGHSKLEAEFKRVNSLDQYGNEGFIVKPTKALVSESVWKEVFLFKKINESIVKIPFSRGRYASMICPNDESFTIKEFNKDEGGEKITIHPQYRGGNK